MKRTLPLVAALASGLILTAAAQTPAAPAAAAPAGPSKIAVIVFQEAVTETNDFQRKFADLQKKFDPKRQELKTLTDDIATLEKQLQAQSATLSDAERAKRAKALDDKQKQLKRSGGDAQSEFQQSMQETYASVASKVVETLNSYAQQHGYTMVLDGGQQQTPVVLYAVPSADITKAVVEAYNVKSGVPAPVAPAKETPKPTPPGQ
jgi:outer membrane protein